MTVRRLIQYETPEAIDTPVLLLAQLREIDETAELVYAGEGRWWLGSVWNNVERRAKAEAMMARIAELEVWQRVPRTIMLCQLNLQGFALIETYLGRDPAGTVTVNNGESSYECTIVEDFRERDTAWRRDGGSAKVKERLLASMREPERLEGEAKMKEYLYTDGRDQYRREFRNRVTVGGKGAREHAASASTSLIYQPDW